MPDDDTATLTHPFTQLAQLEHDWDSYGAVPPTPLAIQRGRDLAHTIMQRLRHLVGDAAWPEAIVPVPDGGVQLEWQGPRAAVEVEIGPQGHYSYLVIDDHAPKRFHSRSDAPEPEVLTVVSSILVPQATE